MSCGLSTAAQRAFCGLPFFPQMIPRKVFFGGKHFFATFAVMSGAKKKKSTMAHFISFFSQIPDDIAPKDESLFQVGSSYQIGGSPTDAAIAAAISRFEEDHGVASWKEVAATYKISEVDYD